MLGQKLIGRYRLDARLGGGAQGEVYLAFDEEINRSVAIKILNTDSAEGGRSAETQTRVRQEAIATAKFEHTNVVRVFDFQVTSDGVPFLVMEHLKGRTLDQIPAPLSPDLLQLLVKQVCAALKNAHKQGLVHRDLKPGNLMLVDPDTLDQRFVILDLGLAKLTDAGRLQHHHTYSGAGTPSYMSPEQVNGESVDYRSDIYSFGTLLFEMLTGTNPFAAQAQSLGSLLKAVCTEPAPQLRAVRRDVSFPPQLERLIADCLQKDPQRRPQSMDEVYSRFQQSYRPPRATGRFSRAAMTLAMALAAVVMLAVAVGFVALFQPDVRRQLGLDRLITSPPVTVDTDGSTQTVPDSHTGVSLADSPPVSKSTWLFDVAIDQKVAEGETVRLPVQAASADMPKRFTWRLDDSPVKTARVSSDGDFEWTTSESDGPGTYTFPVIGVNAKSSTEVARVVVTVSVAEVNSPPVIRLPAALDVVAGETLSLDIRASDPDQPPNRLSFQLGDDAPSGATIDRQTGALHWQIPRDRAGPVPLTVVVRDEVALPAETTAVLTVNVSAPQATPETVQNSIGMVLVKIPAGEFLMGSPDSELLGDKRERPQHRVQISQPFLIGAYEVTQGQYERVMGTNPSKFRGEDDANRPVEQVSWNDAQAFCQRLNQRADEQSAGRNYRLPTEAEWEYVCRAGTTTPFPFGTELSPEYAWFKAQSTAQVGQGRKPNPWGVYDMQGNVWEWCADYYEVDYYQRSPLVDPTGPESGTRRVFRGGGYLDHEPVLFRSAYRIKMDPTERVSEVGFRVVSTPPPATE